MEDADCLQCSSHAPQRENASLNIDRYAFGRECCAISAVDVILGVMKGCVVYKAEGAVSWRRLVSHQFWSSFILQGILLATCLFVKQSHTRQDGETRSIDSSGAGLFYHQCPEGIQGRQREQGRWLRLRKTKRSCDHVRRPRYGNSKLRDMRD